MDPDLNIIDRFMEAFGNYIDSGFGLLSGDVAFLTTVLIGIDVTLAALRSEEHTSELQSLMRISYAVFCLKKKRHRNVKSAYLLPQLPTITQNPTNKYNS